MDSCCCFIFRRDLRIMDNTALVEATNKYKKVYCIFIMTPNQLTKKNEYKSDSAIQFMYESLKELNEKIVLNVYFGNPKKILEIVLKQKSEIKEVFVNQDYTFYSQKRDDSLKQICNKRNVLFSSFEDIVLNSVDTIKTTTGKHYSVFTPYYNNAKKIKVKFPRKVKHSNFGKLETNSSLEKLKQFFVENKNPMIKGGRMDGLRRLNVKKLVDYKSKRDNLNYETSWLSAYIKFGCVSIREVYHEFKNNETLTRQLYWHDFYTTLGFHEIEYSKKGSRIHQPKQHISWLNRDKFKLWKDGKTGFPIVDATMRQLNAENYCHNRGRLIASGFIKFMFMDWKQAEIYYARKLRDYSPSSNYYNWNWSMSFGPFSTPYFRIMNVFIQGKKHDPNAEYIKRWIPELKDVPVKDIHKWNVMYKNYSVDYPKPCVNYEEQRNKTMKRYKEIF